MDSNMFAVLMANNCTPPYAKLVLQVTARHADEHVQHRLISSICHGSQMARIPQSADAGEMIYSTTEHLFNEATRQAIQSQEEAHRQIVSMVCHAAGMGRIATEGAAEIFATVHLIAHESLPTDATQLQRLNTRLEGARQAMGDISHRISMERLMHNIRRQ